LDQKGFAIIDWRELVMLRVLKVASFLHLDRLLLARGTTHPFTEYFKGFDKVKAVKEIFGDKTEEVLRGLKIELLWIEGYLWVNNNNGHLMVSSRYLSEGDKTDIYLDVIHELVHVKQFMEGKELFDERYSYVERPTEIEAYRHVVKEARRLGLSDERICEYLRTEWMSEEEFAQLAKTVNVRCTST
jgi:hypothetical protein